MHCLQWLVCVVVGGPVGSRRARTALVSLRLPLFHTEQHVLLFSMGSFFVCPACFDFRMSHTSFSPFSLRCWLLCAWTLVGKPAPLDRGRWRSAVPAVQSHQAAVSSRRVHTARGCGCSRPAGRLAPPPGVRRCRRTRAARRLARLSRAGRAAREGSRARAPLRRAVVARPLPVGRPTVGRTWS